MKKSLILPECEWILTDEAKNDSRLNPTDKNVLAVLQCVFDKKNPLKNGYYAIILYKKENAAYSLQGDLEAFGFSVSESTVWRSVDKLCRLGYLDYKRGFWNNTTNSGQPSKIKIFKGTKTITDSTTVNCSDIENAEIHLGMDEKKLSSGYTDTCSDIENRKAQSQSKSQSESEALPLAPYGIGNLGLEKNAESEGDSRHEDSTRFLLPWEEEEEYTAQQPELELSDVLDKIEWCIDYDVWPSDISFEYAFQNLSKKVKGLDLNHDYYRRKYGQRQNKRELERLHRQKPKD